MNAATRGIPFLPAEARESASIVYQFAFLTACLLLVGGFLGGVTYSWLLLKHPPGIPIDYQALGREWVRQNEWELAAEEFSSAQRVDPYDVMAVTRLGDALSKTGNIEAEINAYLRYLAHAPANADIHSRLGKALFQIRNFDMAEKHSREAIRLDPGLHEAHLNLAAVGFVKKDYVLAETEFLEAIRLEPNRAATYLGLGYVFANRGDLISAEKCFAEAVRLNPADERAQSILAQARRSLDPLNSMGETSTP